MLAELLEENSVGLAEDGLQWLGMPAVVMFDEDEDDEEDFLDDMDEDEDYLEEDEDYLDEDEVEDEGDLDEEGDEEDDEEEEL